MKNLYHYICHYIYGYKNDYKNAVAKSAVRLLNYSKLLSRFGTMILVLLWAQFSYGQKQQAHQPLDLRILVDVSGSMKTTDPQDLRISALQVLAQLLPEDATVGVWEFADDPSPLLPYGVVNEVWRQRALSPELTVRSDGSFTDIGKALQAVATGHDSQTINKATHIILLTDGVVDIDNNETVNIRARNQLVRFTNLDFVQNGARVHAIGLSNNIDQHTLSELSRNTNGLFAIAHSSKDLLEIFLRALDNSVATQQAVINNQQQSFDIKDNVKSITIVVEKNNAEAVVLQSPSGHKLTHPSNSQTSNNIEWQVAKTHDVITIQDPAEGHWQLISDTAKLVRVNVENQLKLTIDLDDSNLFIGEAISFNLHINDDEGQAPQPTTLENATVALTILNENGSVQWQKIIPVNQTSLIKNSSMQVAIPAINDPSLYRLVIEYVSTKEQQKIERSIRLHAPIDYLLTQRNLNDGIEYEIDVRPLSKHINLDTSKITISATQNNETFSKDVTLAVDKWHDKWNIKEPLDNVELTLKGQTFNGQALEYKVDNVQPKVITTTEVQQKAAAELPSVEILPAASVIEVTGLSSESVSSDTNIDIVTIAEQTTPSVKTLMKELNSNTNTVEEVPKDNEVSATKTFIKKLDANASSQSSKAQNNNVTVDVEAWESPSSKNLVLISILILVIILIWLWYSRKKKAV